MYTNCALGKSTLLNLKTKANLRYIANYSITEAHGNRDITHWIIADSLAFSRILRGRVTRILTAVRVQGREVFDIMGTFSSFPYCTWQGRFVFMYLLPEKKN